MTTDTTNEPNVGKVNRTPPYVSFRSFMTLIEELKTNGLPPRVDRSVLKRFAGGLASQLIMALKSLGLIEDGQNKPTERLEELVRAYGTEEFKDGLRQVLLDSYPFLQDLDLKTATPSMFAEAFRNATAAKEDVLRKCRTFFIHAAQFSGLEVGPRLVSGTGSVASNGAARRRPKAVATKKREPEGQNGGPRIEVEVSPSDFAGRLLQKFPDFDPSWSDELKKAWFADFDKFMALAQTRGQK